jgi:MinD superfamily P-loop ATPase
MNELVVISGKGGTGKTTVVASFAALAERAVLVDCDVDAADLHLVLSPTIRERHTFSGGSRARIVPELCTACGKCEELCRFDAVSCDGPSNGQTAETLRIDPIACEGCGVCAWFCEEKAIDFAGAENGQWYISDTRCGPMVYAKLNVAAENSGKLVTQLRQAAGQIALSGGFELVLCDGSPGIGCPVIASLTGASLALIVVEPTMSGMHDFERIAQLTLRLGVPALVVVNKADLNLAVARRLEEAADSSGILPVGRIPYDPEVTRAQIAARSVVEMAVGPAAEAIAAIWRRVEERLRASAPSQRGSLVQMEVE